MLQVRTQTNNLNIEVKSLNESLNQESKKIIEKGNELIKARKIESNIATCIEQLSNCLPVLECYSKLLKQVNEKKYYPALKTLEQLENDYLPKVSSYRFANQMKDQIPKLKDQIKASSQEDFREFLDNIRSESIL